MSNARWKEKGKGLREESRKVSLEASVARREARSANGTSQQLKHALRPLPQAIAGFKGDKIDYDTAYDTRAAMKDQLKAEVIAGMWERFKRTPAHRRVFAGGPPPEPAAHVGRQLLDTTIVDSVTMGLNSVLRLTLDTALLPIPEFNAKEWGMQVTDEQPAEASRRNAENSKSAATEEATEEATAEVAMAAVAMAAVAMAAVARVAARAARAARLVA